MRYTYGGGSAAALERAEKCVGLAVRYPVERYVGCSDCALCRLFRVPHRVVSCSVSCIVSCGCQVARHVACHVLLGVPFGVPYQPRTACVECGAEYVICDL